MKTIEKTGRVTAVWAGSREFRIDFEHFGSIDSSDPFHGIVVALGDYYGYEQLDKVLFPLTPVSSEPAPGEQGPDYEAVVQDFLKDTDMKIETIEGEMESMLKVSRAEMQKMFITPLESIKQLIKKLIQEHTPTPAECVEKPEKERGQ